jgi:hypothetical protein
MKNHVMNITQVIKAQTKKRLDTLPRKKVRYPPQEEHEVIQCDQKRNHEHSGYLRSERLDLAGTDLKVSKRQLALNSTTRQKLHGKKEQRLFTLEGEDGERVARGRRRAGQVVGAGYPGAPDVRTVAWLVMPGGRIRKIACLPGTKERLWIWST